MIYRQFLILFAFFAQETFALTIKDQRGSIEIDLKNGWEYEQNIFGLPHVFLTKDTPERSSLSLTLTGLEGVNLPIKDLQKNQDQYQAGRKSWAKKREASIEKFIPYSVSENLAKVKIHVIGMDYKMNGNNYSERSFYAECHKSFIHLKLVSPKHELRMREASEMVKNLKCL